MTRRQFRLLVIFNWLMVLVAIIVFFLTRRSLPPELQAYNEAMAQSSRPTFLRVFRRSRWDSLRSGLHRRLSIQEMG